MTDELIQSLSTGRVNELKFATEIIENNMKGEQPPQHILLVGPRGSGKSFFLRLLQIELKKNKNITCSLFPEEQNNFFQPIDFLLGIQEFVEGNKSTSFIARWESESHEKWQSQIRVLNNTVKERKLQHLVIGVENFDLLLGKGGAFETKKDQFALREFLTETPWLTLVATTLYPDINAQYQKALFHAFAKHELNPWQDIHHQAYLTKRTQIEGYQPAAAISQAQLLALTRFTGGSPRITVIMADILSQDKIDTTAQTLEHTIDILTPFYQDLLNRIPTKSRLLFDALIRGGEPCSQSNLAKRVGTTQNAISRSFNWLITHQYLSVDIPKGEKQHLYSVRDRLFAHYYRIRHIHHHSEISILTVMSEFLTTFYSNKKLKSHAKNYLDQGKEREGRDLLYLAAQQSGIDTEKLPWKDNTKTLLHALDLKDMDDVELPATYEEAFEMFSHIRDMLNACSHIPENIDFKGFVELFLGTLVISFPNKIRIAQKCINGNISDDRELLVLLQRQLTELIDDQSSKLGRLFNLLTSAVYQGEIILEYLDSEKLSNLKRENESLYFALLAMYHDKLEDAPSTEILLEAYTHVKAHIENEDGSNAMGLIWNLGRIGSSLKKLGRHEEALKYHHQALELCAEEKGIPGRAFNLEQIGWNLMFLGQYNEALGYSYQALELRSEEKDISGQAPNLGQIGWSLKELGRHDEALKYHHQAIELFREQKDISGQASNLGQMGWNLAQIDRYEEALTYHHQALDLYSEQKEFKAQVWNLERIGWDLKELGRHDEAINYHHQVLELEFEEKNTTELAWNSGQIIVNMILNNQKNNAWEFLDRCLISLKEEWHDMIKQLGDVVAFLDDRGQRAEAYGEGIDIIDALLSRKEYYDPLKAIQEVFIDMIEMQVSVRTLADLFEYTLGQFEDGAANSLDAVSGVIEYLKNKNDPNILIKMTPEIRKAVEVIIRELKV